MRKLYLLLIITILHTSLWAGNVEPTCTPPVLVINHPAAVCAPASVNITLAAVTQGSTPGVNLTYWYNATATMPVEDPTRLGAGSYFIKATLPSNNCPAIARVDVSVINKPSPPQIIVTNNCDGSAILSVGYYPGTLTWNTGATGSSIIVNASGTYSAIINNNGCVSDPGTVQVQTTLPPASPVLTVENHCNGTSTITASGVQGQVHWSNGASNTTTITVNNPGIYGAYQQYNGCSSDQVSVTASPKTAPPVPAINVTDNCNGTSLLQITNANANILWSTGATSASIEVTAAGNYTVTQSADGCTSQPGTAIAAPKSKPVTPQVAITYNCNATATLAASNYTGSLQWQNAANTSAINVSGTGNYSLTQTVNGCTSDAATGSYAISLLTMAAGHIAPNCANGTPGSINVQAAGGRGNYQYRLNNGEFQSNGNFQNVQAGMQTITVKDDIGCTKDTTFEIVATGSTVAANNLTPTITAVKCYNANTGAVTIAPTFTGGSGQLTATYVWSKEGDNTFTAATKDITGLKSGKYNLVITVAEGGSSCIAKFTTSAIVSQPDSLKGTIAGTVTVALDQLPAPEITFSATGGTAPYTFYYKVNDGVTRNVTGTATANVTQATGDKGSFKYTLIGIKDANNCEIALAADATVTVGEAVGALNCDLAPSLMVLPAIARGTTNVLGYITLSEINGRPTDGTTITLVVYKDSKVQLTFDPTATKVGDLDVNNALWTFNNTASNAYYLFTTQAIVPAEGDIKLGFTAKITPGNTRGYLNLTTTLLGGSGGEIRINNNVDSEGIDYFIN